MEKSSEDRHYIEVRMNETEACITLLALHMLNASLNLSTMHLTEGIIYATLKIQAKLKMPMLLLTKDLRDRMKIQSIAAFNNASIAAERLKEEGKI